MLLIFWATRCWFRDNLLTASTFSINIKLSLGLTRQTNHIIHFHKFKKSVFCLNGHVETQNQPAPPFYPQTTQTNQCSATDGAINSSSTRIMKKHKRGSSGTPLHLPASDAGEGVRARRELWPPFKVNVSFFEVFSLISTQLLSFRFRISPHHCSFGS